MSAETNKNLVDYFVSIKPLIMSDDEEIGCRGKNNQYQSTREHPMKIEKTSVNLIKKIWDENKDKEIKLVENIDLTNYISSIEYNDKLPISKPAHCLVVNNNDEMSSRVIAINSEYILEFPQSPTSLDLSDHYHSFSDNDISLLTPTKNSDLKFCDIIKICLSDEIAASRKTKKFSRKNRSMSESYCDVIKDVAEQLNVNLNLNNDTYSENNSKDNVSYNRSNQLKILRKTRSLSESCHDDNDNCRIKKYKGILKHTVTNDSIITETSEEDFITSDDSRSNKNVFGRSDSESSCKKSVRFDDVIKKKLFKYVHFIFLMVCFRFRFFSNFYILFYFYSI